jgi:hypothetical protein
MDGELVYCNDVERLLQELGWTHKTQEFRLLVDLSQFSLKAVLLHNMKTIAQSVHMKEIYENMDLLLKL